MIRFWVPPHLVVSWQARLIERFGGAPGIRDAGLLEGAVARPQNLAAYNPEAGIEQLAALYGVGLTKARAFIDGNKRIGFAVMVAFLKAHGWLLDVSEGEATAIMLNVADGTTDEAALAAWLTRRCRHHPGVAPSSRPPPARGGGVIGVKPPPLAGGGLEEGESREMSKGYPDRKYFTAASRSNR